MQPLFIVFEGVDGSGKTTQIELLKKKFKDSDLKVTDTFEPSDGPIGMLIRNIMRGRIQSDESTVAALFVADRLDHVNNPVNGMKKRLTEGFNVISSRYYFSSYAFQSEFVPIEWVVTANSLAKSHLKPDLVFYLSVDPANANQRITKGRVDIEVYENLDKITKAHNAFLAAFEKYGSGESIHIINGEQQVEKIHDDIWNIVKARLGK